MQQQAKDDRKTAVTSRAIHRLDAVGMSFLALAAVFLAAPPLWAATCAWTGGGPDNRWSTAANWSGDAVPGPADAVVFDGTSAKNCTVDAQGSVASLTMAADYKGTVALSADLTVAGNFSLAGGTLSAGRYALTIGGDADCSAGGSFSAGTGLVKLTGNNVAFTPGRVSFYNLEMSCGNPSSTTTMSGTATVANDFAFTSGSLNTGTVEVQGNVSVGANAQGGTATVKFNGTGAQSVSSSGGGLPNVEVNKKSGTLSYASNVTVGGLYYGGQYTHMAGSLNAGAYRLKLMGNNVTFTPGTVVYHDLEIVCTNPMSGITVSGSATVRNVLFLTAGGLYGGTVAVSGNVVVGKDAQERSTATIRIVGAGDQSISSLGGALPNVEVNKPGGVLRFASDFVAGADYRHNAGGLDAGKYRLCLTGSGKTFVPGAGSYHDLEIDLTNPLTSIVLSGTANAAGSLWMRSGRIAGGTLVVAGDILLKEPNPSRTKKVIQAVGAETIRLVGSGSQRIDVTRATIGKIAAVKDGGEIRLMGEAASPVTLQVP